MCNGGSRKRQADAKASRGIDIAQLDPMWLRRQIGVVLQENLTRVTRELHNTNLNDHAAFASCNPSTELVAKHLHDRYLPSLPAVRHVTTPDGKIEQYIVERAE